MNADSVYPLRVARTVGAHHLFTDFSFLNPVIKTPHWDNETNNIYFLFFPMSDSVVNNVRHVGATHVGSLVVTLTTGY